MQQDESLVRKADSSFRWSTLSEVFAKLASPLINMVLSRLLVPEIFGIVASVSIITSMAETIADGGFGRYIVQHQFSSKDELEKTLKTSFFCSIVFSFSFCVLLFLFRNPLASLVNASGYGWLLVVGSLTIPFSSANGIFNALCRKNFRFKQLSFIRISATLIQSCVEIVLAVLGLGVWSIVVGGVVLYGSRFVMLLFANRSDVHPLGFDKKTFRSMFSFSSLYLFESLLTWFNSSIDIFVVGYFMNQFDAGIYKNAVSTTIGILSLFSAIYSPVLISLLSIVQSDQAKTKALIYRYQRIMSFLFVPLGVGLFLYRDFLSLLFFGSGWTGSSLVVGVFGLSIAYKLTTGDFVMTAFTADGAPINNVISDLAYFVAVVLCCLLFGRLGFRIFVIARSFCYLIPSFVSLLLGKHKLGISLFEIHKNLIPAVFLCCFMSGTGMILQEFSSSFAFSLISIFVCIIIYFSGMFYFFTGDFFDLFKMLFRKSSKD